MNRKPRFAEFIELWRSMNLYEKFEQSISLSLAVVIALIIVISLIQLVRTVWLLMFFDTLNPLDHQVFQTVFGMIMTLLIAMEFKHSIVRVAMRKDSIIQVRTVVLIAVIALARKFVILDMGTDPAKIAALSCAVLALGAVYWLVDKRSSDAPSQAPLTAAEQP